MSYQSLQSLSQLAVLIGLIISALGGYGAFYYGQKIEDEKSKKEKLQAASSKKTRVKPSKEEVIIKVQENNGNIIGKQVNNVSPIQQPKERPVIDLCHRGISVKQIDDTTAYFDIPYCSGKNVNAHNVKLQTAIILNDKNRLGIVAPFSERFPDNITLTYETGKSISYKLSPFRANFVKQIFICVKGSFTNDDETKIYPVFHVYKYSDVTTQWIRAIGDEEEEVRKFLTSQNVL